MLVHCNKIQEEEEEEEKEEEDGDDVEGSPWLNLVIGGASGVGWGEGILVNWDYFLTLFMLAVKCRWYLANEVRSVSKQCACNYQLKVVSFWE